MDLHVRRVIDRHRAGRRAGRHQVAGDFGLAVDHHGLAIGQAFQVDAFAAAVEGQLETIMNQALGVHALTDACLAQQIDHALLKHACADARKDVVGFFALDDHVVDAGALQQLAQQQPGRA